MRGRRAADRAGFALPLVTLVRPASDADRPFVRDLGLRTVGDSVSSCRPAPIPLAQACYERLLEFVDDQSHLTLIAEADGDRMGFLVLLDALPDEVTGLPQAFVAYMAVEPRVRRRGVAQALLRAAEEAARERGLAFLALMVTEDNLAARTLYAQAGFSTERRLLCKAL
jgi:GNAT superfamily N-acetyltransferase